MCRYIWTLACTGTNSVTGQRKPTMIGRLFVFRKNGRGRIVCLEYARIHSKVIQE